MQYGSRPNDTISPSMQTLFDIFASRRGFGYSSGSFQQQCFQHCFIRRVDAFVELPKAGTKVFFSRKRAKPPRSAIHLASARPARKASSHSRRNASSSHGTIFHRIRLPARTHGGTIKFVKQQYMLGGATIFAPRAAAFIMTEAVFINQEEADFHTQRGGPAFQQTTFTL